MEKPLISYDIEYLKPRGTMQQLADWLCHIEDMLADDRKTLIMSYEYVQELLEKYQVFGRLADYLLFYTGLITK